MAEKTFNVDGNGKATILKAVGARKDYGVDLTGRLVPGDALDPTKISAVGVGVTVDGAPFLVGNLLGAWIMGGDPDTSANYVDLAYTTVEGRTDTHRLYFTIQEQGA